MLGGYLLSIQSKQFAVAAFLFAFGAVFAQIGSLALYIRHKAHAQALRAQQTESQRGFQVFLKWLPENRLFLFAADFGFGACQQAADVFTVAPQKQQAHER